MLNDTWAINFMGDTLYDGRKCGPEFMADTSRDWCDEHAILYQLIQPGKPNQSAYIKRFNRSFREEIFNAWVFVSLNEVCELSEAWRVMYNTERQHRSLGDAPPYTFKSVQAERPTVIPSFRRPSAFEHLHATLYIYQTRHRSCYPMPLDSGIPRLRRNRGNKEWLHNCNHRSFRQRFIKRHGGSVGQIDIRGDIR